jgi:hypothetical protein
MPGANNRSIASLADFDFSEWMACGAKLPASKSDLNDLGRRVDFVLTRAFERQLKNVGCEDPGRDTTLKAWDEYIFSGIQEYGPLVLLSHNVVRRIFEWYSDPVGVKKLRRLGVDMAKASKIRRRSGRGKITPKHVEFNKFIVEEIVPLRAKLVTAWPKDEKRILLFINDELSRPDCSFPNLARNRRVLLEFLGENKRVALGFRGTFKPGSRRSMGGSDDVGPARLARLLIAYSENRTEDSVRQELWRQSKQLKPSA